MADDEEDNPRTPSSSYRAMQPFWAKVSAILAGADAMRAVTMTSTYGPAVAVENLSQLRRGRRGPQSPYLPQFENETEVDYDRRRRTAPFTDIYGDVSSNLSSKPFSKLCELDESAAADLKKLQENIDGQGNNLHVFASEFFKSALDKAVDWILVDYTKVPPGTTLADERTMGARPYWVHVPAEKLIAVYSAFLNGAEVVHHARIYEPCVEQSGYGEVAYERVREFNRDPIFDALGSVTGYGPAAWKLWEQQENETSGTGGTTKTLEWVVVAGGPVSIGIIPLVPLVTGKRYGTSWTLEPRLRGLVDLQIEEFQQESNLKAIKELTAFPMLSGNGVNQPKEDGEALPVPVGPRAVLFAPMDALGTHGEWKFLEPAGTSLTFLATDLDKLRTEMRNLGMQPLTTTNLTVITTANVAAKAHNAVQAWALKCKDSLEQAWKITCMWLGRPKEEPKVRVHTDFSLDLDGKKPDALLKAEAQSILSKKTVREEFKSIGMLSDDYDEDQEDQRLAEQQQGLVGEQPIDPLTGMPIEPTVPTGVPLQ